MQSENTQKHLYSNLCTYMDPNMPTAKFLPNSYIILFKNQPLVFFSNILNLEFGLINTQCTPTTISSSMSGQSCCDKAETEYEKSWL